MPDMRPKIQEYIGELDKEILRCISWIDENVSKSSQPQLDLITEIASMKTRMETLLEVRNDLQGRLEELI